MSSEDLVSAYVDGQISRRAFVRRLVAGGVSLGAATSYSYLLTSERAAAAGDDFEFYSRDDCEFVNDFYGPDGKARILGKRRGVLLRKKRVTVSFQISEPSQVRVAVKIRHNGGFVKIGEKKFGCNSAGTFKVDVPINGKGLKLIRSKRRPRIKVAVTAADWCRNRSTYRDKKIFS